MIHFVSRDWIARSDPRLFQFLLLELSNDLIMNGTQPRLRAFVNLGSATTIRKKSIVTKTAQTAMPTLMFIGPPMDEPSGVCRNTNPSFQLGTEKVVGASPHGIHTLKLR